MDDKDRVQTTCYVTHNATIKCKTCWDTFKYLQSLQMRKTNVEMWMCVQWKYSADTKYNQWQL